MNILITGSTGFLGKEILRQTSGHRHFTLNRNDGDFHCDLSTSIPVFDKIFDIVIHNAGKAHFVPKTIHEEITFHKVNVKGTANLLKGLEKNIPKMLIFISSVSVYGVSEGVLIKEDNVLFSKEPYGLSKIQAEKLLQEWCSKHNVVFTILRLPLVVGLNPPGNLGAMIKAINMGYYFNISGGYAKKSMVLAEDVAKYIDKVAEIGGIYNLTDGYHPSFDELSNHISIQLGKGKPMNMPFWLARIIAKLGDLLGSKAPLNTNKLNKITSDLTFDDSKAREVFGWNPTLVLEGFKISTNDK